MSGTICDALMTETPGVITFEINRKLVGEGVTASDEEVGRAVAFAFRELKLVVEPGGAIGLAALLAGKLDVKGKVVVAVLSGGNVDAELYGRLINSARSAWRSRSKRPFPPTNYSLKFSNPAGRAGVRKLLARNKFRTS